MRHEIGILQWIKNWKRFRLILKVTFWHFLTPPHYTNSQNPIISFGYVDSWAIFFLILYPPLENPTTRITILFRKWAMDLISRSSMLLDYAYQNFLSLIHIRFAIHCYKCTVKCKYLKTKCTHNYLSIFVESILFKWNLKHNWAMNTKGQRKGKS